jgi:hypothetical protein
LPRTGISAGKQSPADVTGAHDFNQIACQQAGCVERVASLGGRRLQVIDQFEKCLTLRGIAEFLVEQQLEDLFQFSLPLSGILHDVVQFLHRAEHARVIADGIVLEERRQFLESQGAELSGKLDRPSASLFDSCIDATIPRGVPRNSMKLSIEPGLSLVEDHEVHFCAPRADVPGGRDACQ